MDFSLIRTINYRIDDEHIIEITPAISMASYHDSFITNLYLQFEICKEINDDIELICECKLYENGSIWCFGTNPQYKKKGYGKQMFNEIKSFVKSNFPNQSELYLYCKIENKDALAFYKKLGFTSDFKIRYVYDIPTYKLTYKLI